MGIQIYNTLTNRKEPFEPVNPPKVGIYVCGPTVYKPSHIGHAVGPVIFDAIKRYLVYRGYDVSWVVNITDVEDKLIVEAAEKKMGVYELAEQVTENYMQAMAALNVTGIDHFPKASENIDAIIDVIKRLIDRNAAYESNGDVYFDVSADDDYGKLSNRRSEDQFGQRDLASGEKRNPGDFALWKACKEEEPDEVKFDSPWGMGRPGWHIECTAMSMRLLGETFDIHGGGLDLIFPHHENEIAQSETCTGKLFSKYWMHHGLTRFNTKKVSKSDPEMQKALLEMTLSNLLEKYSGELLRFFILSTQYRRPIEYSPQELESKRKGLNTFYRLFERIESVAGQSVYDGEPGQVDTSTGGAVAQLHETVTDSRTQFESAMDNDFNTAGGIAVMFDLASAINRFIESEKLETEPTDANKAAVLWSGRNLIDLGRLLGVFLAPVAKAGASDKLIDAVMQAHIAVRQAAREAKNYAIGDLIRDKLAAAGVTLEDKAGGTSWNAESAGDDLLENLMQLHIEVRQTCRQEKNFALADLIRDQLSAAGITVEDKPTGTVWQANG